MEHIFVGPDIVKPVANDKIIEMIKYHHYRFDGNGYRQELKGKDIPLGARILAVADTFDAMTSNRPYRNARSLEEAVSEIERCSGAQFDPEVVKGFLSINFSRTSVFTT